MPTVRWILGGALILTHLLYADAPAARYEAVLIKDYQGAHTDQFAVQYDRVRLLVNQAQLEDSSQLGLIQYREGFQYPLTIRFEDGAPQGIENILAYVRLMRGGPKGFAQELVVNMDATASNPIDFDKVFYHEMTHAVMNDAVGGEASLRIPHWVQEGLAQYISGEGDARVSNAAQHFHRSQVQALLGALDGPYRAQAYPQYYLAIAYIQNQYGSTGVQSFVRDLIDGKSTSESIQDSLGVAYDRFQTDAHDYSLHILQDKAKPDF